MLDLPPNLERCSTQYVVKELMRQADAIGHYVPAARALTLASIQYMLSGPRWVNRPRRASLLPHPMGWRINDWLVHVLPCLDSDALAALADLPRFKLDTDIVVPPGTVSVAESAVNAVLPRNHVDLCSIETFICTRVLWTRIDLNQLKRDALLDLFRRYRALVKGMAAVDLRL
jgi:hypothetical protein